MNEVLVIGLLALTGVIFQTVVGFGLASFLTPFLLLYFSPPISVTVTLVAGTVLCLALLIGERRDNELVWPVILRLFIAAVPGLLIGSYIVTKIDKSTLQIVVGILIIVGVIVQEYIFPKPTRRFGVSKGINVSGFIAGIFNASAAQAAPPMILWMRSHKSTPNQIRHNLSAAFILMNICSITVIHFLKHGSLSSKGLQVCIFLLPVVILGNLIGKYLAKRIDAKRHRSIVFVAVVIAGLVSIFLGVS